MHRALHATTCSRAPHTVCNISKPFLKKFIFPATTLGSARQAACMVVRDNAIAGHSSTQPRGHMKEHQLEQLRVEIMQDTAPLTLWGLCERIREDTDWLVTIAPGRHHAHMEAVELHREQAQWCAQAPTRVHGDQVALHTVGEALDYITQALSSSSIYSTTPSPPKPT